MPKAEKKANKINKQREKYKGEKKKIKRKKTIQKKRGKKEKWMNYEV